MQGAALNARPTEQDGPARAFFLLVYALTVAGLVFVFSASFARAGRGGGDAYQHLETQATCAAVGLLAMIIVSHIPLRWMERAALWLFVAFGLLMLAPVIRGPEINGARCWIPVGSFTFQPSEFAKFAYVLYLAALFVRPLQRAGSRGHEPQSWALSKACLATVALLGLLVGQSDQGMALLVALVALAMLYLGGLRPAGIAAAASLLGMAGLLTALSRPHILQRIQAWLEPEAHLQGPGYHLYCMLFALAKGGPFGQGLGFSDDKWKSLPEPFTDSIFCVVGAELGVWGSLLLIGALLGVAVYAFAIARRSTSAFGWYVAVGCGTTLVLQALINIGVATATIPTTGLTLPFISKGGSSLISSLIAAGAVLAVARDAARTDRSQ